jgi:hypothetical protein
MAIGVDLVIVAALLERMEHKMGWIKCVRTTIRAIIARVTVNAHATML